MCVLRVCCVMCVRATRSVSYLCVRGACGCLNAMVRETVSTLFVGCWWTESNATCAHESLVSNMMRSTSAVPTFAVASRWLLAVGCWLCWCIALNLYRALHKRSVNGLVFEICTHTTESDVMFETLSIPSWKGRIFMRS